MDDIIVQEEEEVENSDSDIKRDDEESVESLKEDEQAIVQEGEIAPEDEQLEALIVAKAVEIMHEIV